MKKAGFILFLVLLVVAGGFASGKNVVFGETFAFEKAQIYYIAVEIKEGDTLWDLALEYKPESQSTKEYLKEVKKFNKLKTDKIKAGDTLLFPMKK